MAIAFAPASSTRLANSPAFTSPSSQPLRILTVTGIFPPSYRCDDLGRRGLAHQAAAGMVLRDFGTGQPMLTSTILAPICSTTRAPAILAGSPPKIWMETGRSLGVLGASCVRSMPRTRPSLLTISTRRAHPPGASPVAECRVGHARHRRDDNGDASSILPIFMCRVLCLQRPLQQKPPAQSNPPTGSGVCAPLRIASDHP